MRRLRGDRSRPRGGVCRPRRLLPLARLRQAVVVGAAAVFPARRFHQRRLRAVAEPGHHLARDPDPDRFFDLGEPLLLFRADERDRGAGAPGAAGAADPMHVVVGRVRQVEVDHVRQLLDVEPARRDVGRDEDPHLARLELLERLHALDLRPVAVDRGGMHALAVQLVGEPVCADARRDEDEHLLHAARLDEMHEQLALALARHRVDDVRDQVRGRVLRRDLHGNRVAQEGLGEDSDLVRQRGREQQVLLARGEQRDDPLHVGDEPHVEHAVGLVEDEDLDLPEIERALLHVIEQPARASRRGSRRRAAAPRSAGPSARRRRSARSAAGCTCRRRGRSPRPARRARASARGSARAPGGEPVRRSCSRVAPAAAAAAA